MKFLSAAFGIGLFLVSMFVAVASLFAIVDPVSSKMADDNDPFGPPPSRTSSLAMFCGSIGVGLAGVYLITKSFGLRDRTKL